MKQGGNSNPHVGSVKLVGRGLPHSQQYHKGSGLGHLLSVNDVRLRAMWRAGAT